MCLHVANNGSSSYIIEYICLMVGDEPLGPYASLTLSGVLGSLSLGGLGDGGGSGGIEEQVVERCKKALSSYFIFSFTFR